MVSSGDDETVKLSQPTLPIKEATSTLTKPHTDARGMDGTLESHGPSEPSTPTSAHTGSCFDVDMEGMKPVPSSERLQSLSMSGDRLNSDSSVWPGQAHWREKALAAKRKNRSCRCLAGLSRRTRIMVKIAVVLLVVGVAVGVGFGVSKSLGARVWRPEDDRQ